MTDMENQKQDSQPEGLAPTTGSAPQKRKRRKMMHGCGHCNARFSSKAECWHHMDHDCEVIKKARQEKGLNNKADRP